MKSMLRLFCVLPILMAMQVQAQETSHSVNQESNSSRSKWGASYFNFASTEVEAAEKGTPAISTYNYLSANYKFAKDQRLSLRPAWFMSSEGVNGRGESKQSDVALGDLHLNYSNYSLGLLPGDWELSGQAKLYFPTSESAQMKKTIVYFKGELISEKPLPGGWLLQYTAKPGYWFQSQRSFRNEFQRTSYRTGLEETVVDARVNKWGELNHYFGVGKYVNSIFTPKLEVGFLHEWYYNSEQVFRSSASSNKLKIAPNTEIHVSRKLWFVFGVENQIELNDSRIAANGWQNRDGQSIKLFDAPETQYYLMTFLSL